MIIKGRSRSNGTQLAGYLLHSEENEAVSVLEVSGMATSNLSHALMEMQEIRHWSISALSKTFWGATKLAISSLAMNGFTRSTGI